MKRILALILTLATLLTAFSTTVFAASKCKHRRTDTNTYETTYELSTDIHHIFSGEINKSGKAVGFHYEGLDGVDGKVTKVTKQPNKHGVYEARVEINGRIKDNTSTFFPKDWTPQEVVDSINEAFDNKRLVKGRELLYQGTTDSGLKIEMYVQNGKITSAYPVYE